MNRRTFFVLLGGTAAWPVLARAQQAKLPTIGVLVTGNPDLQQFLEGFREGMRQTGLVEGRHFRLELRPAESTGSLAEKAVELVRLKVDVIVTSLTPSAEAAKRATSDIPIVMAAAGDPVGTGLIASLARPGGNITGVTTGGVDVAGKSVELVRDLFPAARRVAVLANEADPFTRPYVAQIVEGARSIGLEVEPILVRPPEPQDSAFETMTARKVDAVIVQGSLIRKETVDLAIKHRLPSLGSNRSWPVSGGLMSYSASLAEVYLQAAGYVDKILKGRKPADLPVQLCTKFDLVVNMKTAKALGLTVPESFLVRADEVIE
jgi:putative tryptophan/tyrosine transport system substrate-binding protein